MKMIICINNKNIENMLSRKYSSIYDIYVLSTMQQIIKVVDTKEQCTLILRNEIKGDIDFIDFISYIKQINCSNRIIVIIKRLTQDYKEKLFSKEVFNIIEGTEFSFNELIDVIDNPKMVIYKEQVCTKSNVLFITGIKSSGKTIVSKILANLICSNKSKKVILIDMDFLSPSLDLYINSSKNFSLSDLLKDISTHTLKKKEYYETKDDKYKNLSYILNAKALSIPNADTIITLIEYLSNKYDYVIIDTSHTMLNLICDISKNINAYVIFVIEPTLKALREYNANKDFIYTENSKIKLLVNKYRGQHKIINDIKETIPLDIVGIIKYSISLKLYLKTQCHIFIRYNLKKVLKLLGIIKFEKIKLKIIKRILEVEEHE